jgi:DNA-binding NarL/FixJ family response regulator
MIRNSSHRMSTRIGIVEDSAPISRNWIRMLGAQPGLECVGTFRTGEDALQRMPGLKPDVVLMDISLPGMSGIECVAQLKPLLPRTRILMVTVHSDNDRLFQALQAGASGYLLKRTTPVELVAAIHEVTQGGAPMTGEIARRVIESFCRPAAKPHADCNLSRREYEVLELLAQGYLDKEIADRLQISFTTVRSHVAHIFDKLHVRSRVEAATRFVQLPQAAGVGLDEWKPG